MSGLSGGYSTSGGSFSLFYHPNGAGFYDGFTSGSHINFYTSSTIPYQNLYHEYGHLLNNMAGGVFSTALGGDPHYANDGTYLFGGRDIDSINLRTLDSRRVSDPYWGEDVHALQHPSADPKEQWADMWANYVAGNISLAEMSDWVYTHLNP
jgi:hypothetical protein